MRTRILSAGFLGSGFLVLSALSAGTGATAVPDDDAAPSPQVPLLASAVDGGPAQRVQVRAVPRMAGKCSTGFGSAADDGIVSWEAPGLTAAGAADFTCPSKVSDRTFSTVTVAGYFGDPVSSLFDVTVYADSAGHEPGEPVCPTQRVVGSPTGGEFPAYDITTMQLLTACVARPGTNWIEVQAVTGAARYWAVQSGAGGSYPADWMEAEGAYGTGCDRYINGRYMESCIFGGEIGEPDFMFSLGGGGGSGQDGELASVEGAGYAFDPTGNPLRGAQMSTYAMDLLQCDDGITRGAFPSIIGYDDSGERTVGGGVLSYCLDGEAHYVPVFLDASDDVFVIDHRVARDDEIVVKFTLIDPSGTDPDEPMQVTMSNLTQGWTVTDAFSYTRPDSFRAGYERMTTDQLLFAVGGEARVEGDPIPGVDVSMEKNPGGSKIMTDTNRGGKLKFKPLKDSGKTSTRIFQVTTDGSPLVAVTKATGGSLEPYCRAGWPNCSQGT